MTVEPEQSAQEQQRLLALKRYDILDSLPDPYFDQLASLAGSICQVPIASISFIDQQRQWIKAKVGTDMVQLPRKQTICQYVLNSQEPLIIPDISTDPSYNQHPLPPEIADLRFYAGFPLISPDGYILGSLCVADIIPRQLSSIQQASLVTLASQVMQLLEQSRSLRALQRSEKLLQKMSQIGQIGGWEVDLNTQQMNWSEETYRIHEAEHDYQPSLKDFDDFYTPELHHVIQLKIQAAIRQGSSWNMELPLRTAQGNDIWIRSTGEAEYYDKKPVRVWGIIQDINAQKYSQLALARFHRYQNHLSQLAYQMGLSQEELLKQGCDLLCEYYSMPGASINHVQGNVFEVLYHQNLAEQVPGHSIHNGQRFPLEGSVTEKIYQSQQVLILDSQTKEDTIPVMSKNYQITRSIGSAYWVNGQTYGVVSCFGYGQAPPFDAHEKEFMVVFSRWLGFVLERCHYVEHLQKLNRDKDRLLKVVAHDLRNPISAALSAKWVIAQTTDAPQTANHALNSLENACRYALNLISELLASDELDLATGLELETLNLQNLISETLQSFEVEANQKQIKLLFQTDGEPLTTAVHPPKMRRALENLLYNALKFTPAGGQIKISTFQNNEQIWFEIQDNGIGIPLEMQTTLFEKLSDARRPGLNGERSNGLGLFIVKEIIELHGGKIQINSQEHQGTCVRVILPRVQNLLDLLKQEQQAA